MSLTAEQEAAMRANTTTGDPFDVHSASVAAWRNVWALLDEERARASALRDALEDVLNNATCACYEDGEPGHCPRCAVAYQEARTALAQTPAASLAAHDAEVDREWCTSLCSEDTSIIERVTTRVLKARALAAQAATRTEDRWECPTCGLGVSADEDGCCATCGADCTTKPATVTIQAQEVKP